MNENDGSRPASQRRRRTQEERTAHTRQSLIEAAIVIIHEYGYAGANTAMIAKQAGVSRGALLHQFGTRAALMADVVKFVFDAEMVEYEHRRNLDGFGTKLHEWPLLLWSVLKRPSGVAVLEILQASRSDEDLAGFVLPMQEAVEKSALSAMRGAFGGREELALSVMRLMVWSTRGLSIADRHLPNQESNELAVSLLSGMLRLAASDGRIDSLENLSAGTVC